MKSLATISFVLSALLCNCNAVAEITIDKDHYQNWSGDGKKAAVYTIKPALLLMVYMDKYDFTIKNNPNMKPTIFELTYLSEQLSYRSKIYPNSGVLTLDHATLIPFKHSTPFTEFYPGMYLLMIGDQDAGEMITMYTATMRVVE